jgi:hypothetical protein
VQCLWLPQPAGVQRGGPQWTRWAADSPCSEDDAGAGDRSICEGNVYKKRTDESVVPVGVFAHSLIIHAHIRAKGMYLCMHACTDIHLHSCARQSQYVCVYMHLLQNRHNTSYMRLVWTRENPPQQSHTRVHLGSHSTRSSTQPE